ncbi:MAG TPA: nucleotidyltransferase domain-containing protein [Methylomirabilota bacterium]|nr:nucleotidyltransferase domain-containing protein [Methylomirabilota bacterium]
MAMKQAIAHPDLPDASVLERIADRLKREYHAEQVILYGSVARGEATEHSDIDLLVIAPTTEKFYLRMATALGVVRELSRGLPLSPIVLNREEFDRLLNSRNAFVEDIAKEGIPL